MDASGIHPSRINAYEVLTPQRSDDFTFPIADGTAKFSGRGHKFRESTLWREQPLRSAHLFGELQDEAGESRRTESTDDAEARADFWSMQKVTSISRHHVEPRVQLYVPKEETFLITLQYIDVTRAIYTDLDVLQEKKY